MRRDGGDPRRRFPLLAAALVALFGVAAATGPAAAQSDDEQKGERAATVDLPEPPLDSAFEVKKRNSDGTFRVRGLIAHRGKHLGDSVEIKGVVTHVSPECDPARAQEKGKECPQPYLYIRDEKGADDALMIVGFQRDKLREVDLEEGSTHVFEGTYKELAQGFVRTESGLLLVDTIDDTDVVGGE